MVHRLKMGPGLHTQAVHREGEVREAVRKMKTSDQPAVEVFNE